MPLNDLKAPKNGVLMIFLNYEPATQISKMNCDDTTGDRPKQPANINC